MKSNKLTKIIIGRNQAEEIAYKTSIDAKISAFNELYDYLSIYVTIEDKQAFSEAPTQYFKNKFLERYQGNFPSIINYEKLLELCNISLHRIESLEGRFTEIDIPNFNAETLTAPEVDFNLYAKDEASEVRYKKTKKIVDTLNEWRNENNVFPANIIQGLQGAIAFDFGNNQFAVNVNYVNDIPYRNY